MNFTMKSRIMPNKSNMNIIDKNKFIHFDYEFYKRTYTDLEEHNITTKEQCFTHYLLCGIKEERSCCEAEMTTKYQSNMQKDMLHITIGSYHFCFFICRISKEPSFD